MNMLNMTFGYAIILIVLGLVGYFGLGRESLTALIPAFFGAAVLLAALVATRETMRRHAMHVAVVLAVLAFAGTVSGVPKAITLLSGGEVARPNAVIVQAVMAILSLAYVAFAVRSFINARRKPVVSSD